MKIAVNLLYLESDTKAGVGKHIEDILTGLEKLNVLDEFYLIVRDTFYDGYFCPVNTGRPFKNVHVLICPEGKLFEALIKRIKKGELLFRGIYLNYFVMPKYIKDIKFDLMFYPFNDVANNVSLKYPLVAVIHDLFYKNFPNRKKTILSKLYAVYVDVRYRAMLKKTKKIVAISEFVKSDILKNFPFIKDDDVVVIPNAVVISEETAIPDGIKKPFLLCLNEHGIHKNHLTLLKAYNVIRNKIPHRLVLLGREREETPNIMKYINENKMSDRIDLISNISDAKRNWLYRNADLFISPSLHEGFGRTPIEAAMLGAMVLTSRETSLPEVTCEMLNYYEPATDEKVLAEKIMYLLAHPASVEKHEQIAKTFKELYDPVVIAKLYYDLFHNIVHNNK